MILPSLLLLAAQAGPPAPAVQRYAHCTALIATDALAAQRDAELWASQARPGEERAQASLCLGLAYVARQRFADAAPAFDAAAAAFGAAHAVEAAQANAQAGNAWIAAGDPARARAALDAALAAKTLTGLQLGEAHLDRARALVAANQLTAARIDMDAALETASDDPLAWLLSATLARRMGELPRARTDIATALRLAGDAPQVHLEAGNIAAASGDAAGARKAWEETARHWPETAEARAASIALRQFEDGKP